MPQYPLSDSFITEFYEVREEFITNSSPLGIVLIFVPRRGILRRLAEQGEDRGGHVPRRNSAFTFPATEGSVWRAIATLVSSPSVTSSTSPGYRPAVSSRASTACPGCGSGR